MLLLVFFTGWEAIEKYLTQVEKEIGDIFDQQVSKDQFPTAKK